MNYLTEINAFERRMRRRPLPATAQLLWYKLMHFANRLYWPERFEIDNEKLADLLGSSIGTARSARDALVEDGILEYQRGTKMHPNQYHLVSLVELEAAQRPEGEDYEDFGGITVYAPKGVEGYSEVEDLKKYFGYTEEAADEAERTAKELFSVYLPGKAPDRQDVARVFLLITDKVEKEHGPLLQVTHEKKELLAYAFEQASRAGVVNWNYIDGIYRNLRQRGIQNVDQAYTYDIERLERRTGG